MPGKILKRCGAAALALSALLSLSSCLPFDVRPAEESDPPVEVPAPEDTAAELRAEGYAEGYAAGYADGAAANVDLSGSAPRWTVSGDFSAQVRAVLPDYMLDGETPQVLVLTSFQSGPFTLHIGGEASQFEVGKVYTFTIEPVTAPEEIFFPEDLAGRLRVSSWREMTDPDTEWGLFCSRLVSQPTGAAG